ncbi:MAG: rRNA maturation RNase YbeY [Clostridia bacterium]|nr:rRNA maturation RNase YbeY [Clostridia bacterium]
MKLTTYIKDEQNIYDVRVAMKAIVRKAVFNTLVYEGFDKNCEVSVTFVDNEAIKELNKTYRNKNRETDVLSFPMFEDFNEINIGTDDIPLGDIVISLEKAAKQGYEIGHSIYHEVAFLCVHSTLHLLGYDHETSKEDEKEMFRKQKEIMEIMGF